MQEGGYQAMQEGTTLVYTPLPTMVYTYPPWLYPPCYPRTLHRRPCRTADIGGL